MKSYVTVVFEINDPAAWKDDFDKIHKKMGADESEPWRVTAMSLDDEMCRISLIEQALELDDPVALCGEILGSANIHSKQISDFCSQQQG